MSKKIKTRGRRGAGAGGGGGGVYVVGKNTPETALCRGTYARRKKSVSIDRFLTAIPRGRYAI